ncbi:MAG TPA: metal-dependent hydrolase, partial [Turneriella sp.]|nr:metal-dependent hydrolase [Turneriella sp.]
FHGKVFAEDSIEHALRWLFGDQTAERMSLSVTAALEHYTSTLGEVVLKNEAYYTEGMPDSLKQLFLWHAAEEVEHKSVAYDVFHDVAGGNYLERQVGFAFGSFFLAYYIGIGWAWYLAKDKERDLAKLPQDLLDSVPVYFNLLKDVIIGGVQYLKPGFHPDQMDNDHLARELFSRYEAEFAQKSA